MTKLIIDSKHSVIVNERYVYDKESGVVYDARNGIECDPALDDQVFKVVAGALKELGI